VFIVAAWLSSNALVLNHDQRSCSTPCPVTAVSNGMGDRSRV